MPDPTIRAGVGRFLPAPAGPTRTRRVARTQSGVVTAETAVILPVLVAVTLGLVWLLAVGITHVRVVDAARETARAAARGETQAEAVRLGRLVAPEGASIEVREHGSTLTVRVRADVSGPGGLFGFLPTLQVHGSAVTAVEPS